MIYADWTDHPDEDIIGVYWVRWRGKMTTRKWHSTIDGERTLCHLNVRYPLYIGRQPARCSRCVTAAKRLNEPE